MARKQVEPSTRTQQIIAIATDPAEAESLLVDDGHGNRKVRATVNKRIRAAGMKPLRYSDDWVAEAFA